MARILIVDDEPNIRATVGRALALEGHFTETAADGETALANLNVGGFHLAVVDLSMPGLDGLELLTALRERGDDLPVIILTAHGSIPRAVAALKLGAHDFLEKPPDRRRLLHAVGQALEVGRLKEQVAELQQSAGGRADQMIGSGPGMENLKERIRLAAPTDGRILITGENGTGKELVAQAVHAQSLRRAKPFVKLNCAAVPQSLFESELFGHVKGAFTGAIKNRRGRFERADGGTLFLDEVGEIPIHLQAKLLRALETGEVERLGGPGEFHVDVRLVAATNMDLERAVEDGRFRPDLYYRLDVVRLHVPPLRDRAQDIPVLARRFLEECCRRNGQPAKEITAAALERLKGHSYPGNVRELRNAMERLAILTPGRVIRPADVEASLPRSRPSPGPQGLAAGRGLKQQMEALERQLVEKTLVRHAWRMAAAARELGLERSHLYKKMRALGIRRPGS